jgi:hypothetical protein
MLDPRHDSGVGTLADSRPLPRAVAWRAVARCVGRTLVMLARRDLRQPEENLGLRIRFADGTTGVVYRETRVDRPPPAQPCVLVVSFRLRRVRGWGHRVFEVESLLNTLLFAGFPGLVSKLWLAHDDRGTYRGLYEWDGPRAAEDYARALWRVLALVSETGSIDFRVLPGLRRDEVLADPSRLDGHAQTEPQAWWRVVEAA